MKSSKPQNTFEKTVNAALFVALIAAGWLPFFYFSIREPYANPALLAFSAALAVMAAALVFDSAERMLGIGKGIYAVAILCSFPAVGAIISNSSLLPMSGLFFISAATVWLAVRAHGDDLIPMLAMLGSFLLITGYLFSFFPATPVLLFSVWLSIRESKQKPLIAIILIGCFVAGTLLKSALDLNIPSIVELSSPPDFSNVQLVLLSLPWTLWLIPGVIAGSEQTWMRIGSLAILLAFAVGFASSLYPLAVGCIAAPAIALIATASLFELFANVRGKWMRQFPILFSAAAFLTLVYVRINEPTPMNRPIALLAVFTATLALMSLIRKRPRWSFAAVVLGGLILGALVWTRPGLLDSPDTTEASRDYTLFAPVFIAFIVAIQRRYYGRRIPRAALSSTEVYQFTGENIRRFDNGGRKEWGGESVAVAGNLGNSFNFAIFGDIAGAESPFGSRSGGYFIFRSLCREFKTRHPDFVICLGDLSLIAQTQSYRRLRQMLKHFPSPLSVTPGNHDIFEGDVYRPQLFHALFGADHSEFTAGGNQFVLFNNARGGIDEEQFTWLESVLQKNGPTLRVVFCHKPLFDPRENKSYQMENREHADRLHNIFRTFGVTAVFSGHIHSLIHAVRDGVTYVISGGGGSNLVESDAAHHYLWAEVHDGVLKVVARAIEKSADVKPLSLEFRGKT